MRQLVAVAGLILIAGIVGTFLTIVVYLLAGLAALGLSVMLVGWISDKVTWRQASKRIHATAASVEAKTATLEDEGPERLPEDLRHPAWKAALDEQAQYRRRVAERYLNLRARVSAFSTEHDYRSGHFRHEATKRTLDDELAKAENLVRERLGVSRARVIGRGLNNEIIGVDLEPPRDEVIHLGRRFSLVADCRYGHCASHNIIGVTGAAGEGKEITNVPAGRLLRECDVCQPATRWTENP